MDDEVKKISGRIEDCAIELVNAFGGLTEVEKLRDKLVQLDGDKAAYFLRKMSEDPDTSELLVSCLSYGLTVMCVFAKDN